MLRCFTEKAHKPVPIDVVVKHEFDSWLTDQNEKTKNWVNSCQFKAESGQVLLVPHNKGHLERAVIGLEDAHDSWAFGALPNKLPKGDYYFNNLGVFDYTQIEQAAVAWGLGAYQFTPYKDQPALEARLKLPDDADHGDIDNRVRSCYLVRDLINTPTEDLGPPELAEAVEKVAEEFGAELTQTIGDDLLEQSYPAIHAVGRASSQHPRLLDLRWGRDNPYKITLVGKGVCFDSGGLDLKPPQGMQDMKKDMGGAAQALGLARAIMAADLPVNLRLLIPAVENAVSGDAYRPGDIIRTRNGKTVEVTNTDAEGRLILCDALTEAAQDEPELLVDFATLTGAARVALGPDISALFSHDETVAKEMTNHGYLVQDPVWRLPLYNEYKQYLKSQFADIANAYTKPYAGAITAALFLGEFVPKNLTWVHFDIMGSNIQARPGRPEGGEAMAMPAVFNYLKDKYAE